MQWTGGTLPSRDSSLRHAQEGAEPAVISRAIQDLTLAEMSKRTSRGHVCWEMDNSKKYLQLPGVNVGGPF